MIISSLILLIMGLVHDAAVGVLFTVKQILLDLSGLLQGNLTYLLSETIDLLAILAGVLYDGEALLEKVITLLTG